MKRVLILGFTALALIMSAPVFAQKPDRKELMKAIETNNKRKTQFYQALDAAADRNNAFLVFDLIGEGIHTGGNKERDIAIQWLTDNTFIAQETQKRVNAFYFMFLSDLRAKDAITADQLGKIDEAGKAASVAIRALLSFEIMAQADAVRCDDPSLVTILKRDLVDPKFWDLRFALKNYMTKEQFDSYVFDAIELESSKSTRPVNLSLCTIGELAKKDPKYKPPAEMPGWSRARHELRIDYKKNWTDRYYELRDEKKKAVKKTPSSGTPQ